MNEELHDVIISFNNTASIIYANLFSRFTNSVQQVSRKTDENVYRMQVAKYTDELKNRLDEEARKLITANPQLQQGLSPTLLARVNFYVQEFSLRCKAY